MGKKDIDTLENILCALSISEIFYIFAIIPLMLSDQVSNYHTISFLGCANQMFFIFAFTHSFLLMIMGYDHYVALCHPLCYNVFMNPQGCAWLMTSSWLGGVVIGLVVTFSIFHLNFCGPNKIHHFFCHVPPFVKLAYGDISSGFGKVCISVLLGCFLFILLSYAFIVVAILRIPSTEGHRKAFSTCVSHLTVVVVSYGFASDIYLIPNDPEFLKGDILMGIAYTPLTPFLSPIISLRNKVLKNALKKVFFSNQYSLRLITLSSNQEAQTKSFPLKQVPAASSAPAPMPLQLPAVLVPYHSGPTSSIPNQPRFPQSSQTHSDSTDSPRCESLYGSW
ncbi:olfactory receptor 10H1-like [Sminthopsis crassicaudata]|uniref:olfactory receptor 10H1-like n=1 Tax=Sminthopsis crassicaudata TaxID=9301 RepID=UPI003D685E6A